MALKCFIIKNVAVGIHEQNTIMETNQIVVFSIAVLYMFLIYVLFLCIVL